MPNPKNSQPSFWQKRWKAIAVLGLIALVAVLILKTKKKEAAGTTFAARRGALSITVTENGSIEAQQSQEIRSEVKGWEGTKILTIVEEGYQVTEDDVKTNKVLVELDSSQLRKTLTTVEIDVQAKQEAVIVAKQAYEIQLTQNRSDITAAQQKAKFARWDLEKFLGDKATMEITRELGLERKYQRLTATNDFEGLIDEEPALPPSDSPASGSPSATSPGLAITTETGVSIPATTEPAPPSSKVAAPAKAAATQPAEPKPDEVKSLNTIDLTKYAVVEMLGDGEAQQKLRDAKDTLLLAEKERGTSKAKCDGTERLFQNKFVTKTELDTARLEYEQVDLKVKKSATALNLFIKYEFPKAGEENLSKYDESLRTLERTRKEAVSKLAQARGRMKSAEQQYRIVQEQRRDLQEQVDKCVMRAKKTGLVIYGGGGDGMFYYGEERIREGALIRERQPIITIPDMTKMAIKVKIHESHIKKIKKGMQARIRVDAQPDKQLTGDVTKVGVLPDTQNRWLNPDLKVYSVTINIEGTHDWLKPGMSAKVEILVNELKDVVYVPVQAVIPLEKQHVCFLPKSAEPERRPVVIGEYSDEFIEIKSGLKEGEVVMLRTPEGARGGEKSEEKEKSKETPKAPAPAPPS